MAVKRGFQTVGMSDVQMVAKLVPKSAGPLADKLAALMGASKAGMLD